MNGSNHTQFKRSLEDLLNLRRSMWANYLRAAQLGSFSWQQARKPFGHQMKVTINTIIWILIYLKHRFGLRHPFQDYEEDPSRGVFPLAGSFPHNGDRAPGEQIRVSIAGDWGTGAPESSAVASRIREFNPHYTIHLGDIYFVGDKIEVEENCLGNPRGKNIHAIQWPIGSRGSFALNGNHEMYANGSGYFKVFLPRLGMRPGPKLPPGGQRASFFALANDYWIIVGVDTGYNSVGLPILEWVPHLRKIPHIGGDCSLPPALMRWLKGVVRNEVEGRSVILLSHHQYFSSFEHHFSKAGAQLLACIGKPALWFWGNEHRMAIYGQCSNKKGIEAYGRCIGHGGMPATIRGKPRHKPGEGPLVVYDDREYRAVSGIPVGFNGYANLIFEGPRLKIEYRDIRQKDNLLLTEQWETHDGLLTGTDIRLRTTCRDFIQYHPDLRSAIGGSPLSQLSCPSNGKPTQDEGELTGSERLRRGDY
ncbi:MAG: metallophosphoesterase [Acidobacteriota bacterium]|nr:metallophosphoesterase [Acidobacteriota bacterium]